MRLEHDKPPANELEHQKSKVLPGIIATVSDDKKNEVYLDLDLELDEIIPDTTKAASSKSDVPPGLISTVKTRKNGKHVTFPAVRSLERKKVYAISAILFCMFVIGILLSSWFYSAPEAEKKAPSSPVRQTVEIPPANPLPPPSPEAAAESNSVETADTKQSATVPEMLAQQASEAAPTAAVSPQVKPATTLPDTTAEAPVPAEKKTAQSKKIPSQESVPPPESPPAEAISAHDSLDYYLYSGHACEQRGDFTGALHWYKKALALHAEDYRLQNKTAYVLMRLSLYSDAETYLKKAVALNGMYMPALINLGVVSGDRGDFTAAEKYLSRALDIDSTNADALYNIMLVYRGQNKFSRAADIEAKLKNLGYQAEAAPPLE